MIRPRPVPPEAPLPGDCCDGGCDPCVLEQHAEAMAHYAAELDAWRLSGEGGALEGGHAGADPR